MSVCGYLVVVHIQQAEALDDAFRCQVVILAHKGFQKRLVLMLGAEGLDLDTHGFCHTDGIGDLDFAFIRISGSHDINLNRNFAHHICARTVNLTGILSTVAGNEHLVIGIAGTL